jgi:hypothetical protein
MMGTAPFRVATGAGLGMSVHAVAALIQHEAGKARTTKVTKKTFMHFARGAIFTIFVTFVVLALPASC